MWCKNCLMMYVILICSLMFMCHSTLVVKAQNIEENNGDDDLADFEFYISSSKNDGTINSKSSSGSSSNGNNNNKKVNNDKFLDYYDENQKLDDFFNFNDDEISNYEEEEQKSTLLSSSSSSSSTVKRNGQNAFDIKEKVMRIALSKALTNKMLRQKFVEVIPILRVLSSQQRLALSALISAQVSAKPGTELKLDQVKNMFGDSKKLIIPLVFDIANLVRTAAKTSFHMQYDTYSDKPRFPQKVNFPKRKPQQQQNQIQKKKQEQQPQKQPQISRRNFEETIDDTDEIPDEIIDAKQINDELYYTTRKGRILKLLPKQSITSNITKEKNVISLRKKRSLSPSVDSKKENSKFSQKMSSFPLADRTLYDRKLNISNYDLENDHVLITDPFKSSDRINSLNSAENSNVSYYKVEDLAFSDLNGTESINTNSFSLNETEIEELPVPESLIGSRNRLKSGNKLGNGPRNPPIPVAQQRYSGNNGGNRPRKPPSNNNHLISKCEHFTPSMCIHADDYPMEQIMGSIRRHKHAMSALLAEYRDKTSESEYQEYLNTLELNKKRREDNSLVTPGGLCSSIVRYARPQKARSATGEWKYIVNTGQHTQTLRLEKCSNPKESCSYLSENFRSRCLQVYNYHRLLSWDKSRGLHVDIFKVPTCCSCHVDGYRETFPPLTSPHFSPSKLSDFTSVFKNNQYSTTSEEDELESPDEEDSEEESIAYQFANGFRRVKPNKYEPSELYQSSSNLKHRLDFSKIGKSPPTLGSYLRPPLGEFDAELSLKRGPNLTSNKNGINTRTRRPPLNSYLESDDRADIDQMISETEVGKEVTVFPSSQKPTMRPKRIKYVNNSVSTSAPTKSISTFSSTPSSTTHTTKTSPSTKTIYSTKLTNAKSDVSKRINYNYHPIIDFFDEHASLVPSTSSVSPVSSTSGKKVKKGGVDIGLITSTNSRIGLNDDTNDWRPLIIQ